MWSLAVDIPFDKLIEGLFGFYGKEGDDEWNAEGSMLDFGARIYDSRLGRFLSCDPLENKFESLSSYGFAMNCVLAGIDEGGESLRVTVRDFHYSYYHPETGQLLDTPVIVANFNVDIYGKLVDLSTLGKNGMESTRETAMREFTKFVDDKSSALEGIGEEEFVSCCSPFGGESMAKPKTIHLYGSIRVRTHFVYTNNLDEIEPTDHVIAVVDNIPKLSGVDPGGLAIKDANQNGDDFFR